MSGVDPKILRSTTLLMTCIRRVSRCLKGILCVRGLSWEASFWFREYCSMKALYALDSKKVSAMPIVDGEWGSGGLIVGVRGKLSSVLRVLGLEIGLTISGMCPSECSGCGGSFECWGELWLVPDSCGWNDLLIIFRA